jgi:hypothetical protein
MMMIISFTRARDTRRNTRDTTTLKEADTTTQKAVVMVVTTMAKAKVVDTTTMEEAKAKVVADTTQIIVPVDIITAHPTGTGENRNVQTTMNKTNVSSYKNQSAGAALSRSYAPSCGARFALRCCC